jgi:hypothetical protein
VYQVSGSSWKLSFGGVWLIFLIGYFHFTMAVIADGHGIIKGKP